jgi:hypothetical protein
VAIVVADGGGGGRMMSDVLATPDLPTNLVL